ncbi:MAG: hypothetical protein VB980_01305 [Opitutales bacterium]
MMPTDGIRGNDVLLVAGLWRAEKPCRDDLDHRFNRRTKNLIM